MRILYWLYYGDTVLTAVLAEPGCSDAVIIGDALRSHESVPLCYPDYAPFEWANMLRRAEVRT